MDTREDSLIVSRRANLEGGCTHLGGALARHPGAGTVIYAMLARTSLIPSDKGCGVLASRST